MVREEIGAVVLVNVLMDFDLLEQALSYTFLHLDFSQQAQQLGREAPSVVHRIVLKLNVEELHKQNERLGSLVLTSFEEATKIFQLVCFTSFKTLDLLPSLKSRSQLSVVLRLSNIPSKNCLPIDDALLIRSHLDEIVQLEGQVYSKSVPDLYTQSARYRCPAVACPGSDPYRYIRLHCNGASEAETIRGHFSCEYCGHDLQEDVKSRVLSDRCYIQLISSDVTVPATSGLSSTATLHRAITVVLRDDLVKSVSIGQRCRIVGQRLFEAAQGQTQQAHLVCTFEANNVQPICNFTLPIANPAINDKISKLKQACAYSPWAFPATVAYSLAALICPPGVFHRLKLAILLSLVSAADSATENTGSEEQQDLEEEIGAISNRQHGLHVLSISSDDLIPGRLMSYCSQLSPISFKHNQITSDLFGATCKDTATGGTLLSAGSLLLPARGLCFLGNLSQYKKDTLSKLQQVLEDDSVAFPVPTHHAHASGSKSQKDYIHSPLQCGVWCYADGNGNGKKAVRNKSSMNLASLSKALIDRFDIVVNTNSGSVIAEDLAELRVCQALLEASCSQSSASLDHTEYLLDDTDIQHLIYHAGAKKPTLTRGSQDLIRSFYMASRRMRSSGAFGTDMPATAIQSMTCIAAAHAALCLRSEVTEDDATAAILLFEEAMVACYGTSVVNVMAQPHFRDQDLDVYLGEQHCAHMRQFQTQLRHFCAVHANGGGSSLWEE